MTPGEWETIKYAFEAARHLDSAEQSRYLDEACARYPHLRATVEELLRNDADAGSFLEEDTVPFPRRMFEDGAKVAGRFRILRFIAHGGMGEVYEAFDSALGRRVALKTLRREFLKDRESLGRFRREVWVMTEVSHPGICRVFDLIEHHFEEAEGAGSDEPLPCLTMELLEGRTLQEELRQSRPLPPQRALEIVRQVSQALEVLHAKGIIHRDLKPSNIMLIEEPAGLRAVLTDFGLARPVERSGDAFRSASDVLVGAPFFLAPEVIRGGLPSKCSDIYSLGLVIDEMVSLTSAFPCQNMLAVYRAKLFGKPAPLSHRSNGLPPHWERVVGRCLMVEPALRYPSALEVYRDLAGDRARSAPMFRRKAVRRALILTAASLPLLFGGWAVTTVLSHKPEAIVYLYLDGAERDPPEMRYLTSGFQDALARRLGQVPGFQVQRLPSLGFRPPKAEKLQVGVTGTVTRTETTVVARVAIVDPFLRRELWSSQRERQAGNDLRLQDEICDELLLKLRVEALEGSAFARELRGAASAWWDDTGLRLEEMPGSTRNAEAYNAYMRGKDLYERRTEPMARLAEDRLLRAIALDPRFALPYAVLSDAQRLLMDLNASPQPGLLEKAETYAARALELAPDLPEAQMTVAANHQIRWRWAKAREHYEAAIRLAPRSALAHYRYAGLFMQTGPVEEGLRRAQFALSLDPYHAPNVTGYGYMLLLANRPAECAMLLERLLQRQEERGARQILGVAYAMLAAPASGETSDTYLQKALVQAEILREGLNPESAPVQKFPELITALAYAYRGQPSAALPALHRLERGFALGRISPVVLADVYAVLGREDAALDLLERAADGQDRGLLNVKTYPPFTRMSGHPRMVRLLRRMGLG
jgi:tRNA A-37 threonylcarbamoyl transferase component Bud32/tetratricopeptide (TPR) repeat protein/TolB-like protein